MTQSKEKTQISWEETDTKADAPLRQGRQRKQRTTPFASAVFCYGQMQQQKIAKNADFIVS